MKKLPKYIYLILITLFSSTLFGQQEFKSNTELYNYLKKSILEREAFSEDKLKKYNLNIEENIEKLKKSFKAASSAEELYFEILKLSNLRQDSHLKLKPLFITDQPKTALPIKLEPEFTDNKNPKLLLSAIAEGFHNKNNLSIGDELVEINGMDYNTFVEMCKAYIPASTPQKFYYELAKNLCRNSYNLSKVVPQDKIVLNFKNTDGKVYSQTLNFVSTSRLFFKTHFMYAGFTEISSNESFITYVYNSPKDIILLELIDFSESFPDDIDELMDWAIENRKLNASLIIDARNTDGGKNCVYALKNFTNKPFAVTKGNLKISDITYDFVENKTKRKESAQDKAYLASSELNDKSMLNHWLSTSVLDSINARANYSEAVPFKLMYPVVNDTIYPPHVHFRGNLVVLLNPQSGSQIDQFASIIVDNKLGYTIGMPSGGYSNTWEWKEKISLPKTDTVVCEFKWSIGQTIRPNGEILEGNPAAVDDYFPPTKANFENYNALILKRAIAYILER